MSTYVVFFIGCLLFFLSLSKLNNINGDCLKKLNLSVRNLIKTVDEATQQFEEHIEELSLPVQSILIHMDIMLAEHRSRLNVLEIDQSYLLQTIRFMTSETNAINVCIRRDPSYNRQMKLGCFVETFCQDFVPIETETIDTAFQSCLPVLYKLKRLHQHRVFNALPQSFENNFVEELHLSSSEDLDLKGIEKMPSLRTLVFEDCKNIFLDHLLNTTHSIDYIYAINTPCLLQYEDKLKAANILLIVK